LFAGGPSREFLFLRNQLHRDEHAGVDVLLQSAHGSISQDARRILERFPESAEDLFAYDCLVAFDPDWRTLSDDQIKLVNQWVADQAGGMIVVAGPVFSNAWVQDPRLGPIRDLYPVEFFQRFSRFDDNSFGRTEPQKLELSGEGEQAEFLWLDDTRAGSEKAWQDFPGAYGYYTVRGPKPGATVYAYAGGEGIIGEKSIFMAEHFFGAGRVFFLASGEMWRTRAIHEAYFEKFYTKVVRHVSEGRLLRGSSRGMLLVDRQKYRPGDTVQIRARLLSSSFRPLAVAEVSLDVQGPNKTTESVTLRADGSQEGMYHGQFAPLRSGTYELSLLVPETSEERINRRIQVEMPQLEREHPERNDSLLSELARETGGEYYRGLPALHGEGGAPPLLAQLKDKTRSTYVAGPPDRLWERTWLKWLLVAVCGLLGMEWLLRRLWRLA
jgi:hypothetical protein